jgi:hypothetical protein
MLWRVSEQVGLKALVVECVFAREFWFILLRQVGLQALSPQPTDNSFLDWWERANNATSDLVRQGVNSLIVFGAWTLWNHRNRFLMERLQVWLGL